MMVTFLAITFVLAAAPAQAASDSQFFAPTGLTVSGTFLAYWQSHGGLTTFGYPITSAHYELDPISGKQYLTQWFERNRFELHPENIGNAYEVLLGLLGRQVTSTRFDDPAFMASTPVANSSTRRYFSSTSHSLSYGFKQYWEANGGLERFGYPISEEFQETTISGTYTVQYFERARFEYHPEKQPPFQVLLGLLGVQLLKPIITPVINDQTSPLGLLNSYYNAINRQEYQRAYNYWTGPGSNMNNTGLNFNAFAGGFTQTASTGLSTGPYTGNGAAGSVYYAIPAVIISTQKNNTQQYFYGCYLVRQVNVQISNQPFPNPLYISAARIMSAPANTSFAALMSQAIQFVQQNQCGT